jgi:hypothetical protein
MADENVIAQEPAEEAAVEDTQQETVDVQDDAQKETEPKETKTLLSDDGGDGSGEDDFIEYEFTPPEGFDISEEAQNQIEQFAETAGELGISQEQFQRLVEFDISRGQKALVEQANAYIERINEWGEQAKADKEIGGEALDANLGNIRRVTDAYGDKELMALMGAPGPNNPDGLGLGNHPVMLRFLHRVAKSLSDSELIEGDGHKSANGDNLQRMYPTMFKNAS